MEIPLKQFAELQDPRLARTRRHLLGDIVLLAIAAILSGAEGWDDMERYGKAKRNCLKSFLALPFGIPSHDTFNRVFQVLEPAELKKQFLDWVSVIARRTQGEVVAIDGKSLRGTGSSDSKSLVHMVSAWASANNMVLDQRIAERGLPRAIRCDNGPELTSRHFLAWALDRKIDLVHIQPGKATQQPELHDAIGVRRKSKPWKRRRLRLLGKRYCRFSLFHRYGCGWMSIICMRKMGAGQKRPSRARLSC